MHLERWAHRFAGIGPRHAPKCESRMLQVAELPGFLEDGSLTALALAVHQCDHDEQHDDDGRVTKMKYCVGTQ